MFIKSRRKVLAAAAAVSAGTAILVIACSSAHTTPPVADGDAGSDGSCSWPSTADTTHDGATPGCYPCLNTGPGAPQGCIGECRNEPGSNYVMWCNGGYQPPSELGCKIRAPGSGEPPWCCPCQ